MNNRKGRTKQRSTQQPPGTKICGQCCVAILSGLDIDAACELVGHRKATRTRELVTALWKMRVNCAKKRLTPVDFTDYTHRGVELPQLALCKAQEYPRPISTKQPKEKKRSESHWIILFQKWIYDPALPKRIHLDKYLRYHLRITSYIQITNFERRTLNWK